jgi:hypothetical protein
LNQPTENLSRIAVFVQTAESLSFVGAARAQFG